MVVITPLGFEDGDESPASPMLAISADTTTADDTSTARSYEVVRRARIATRNRPRKKRRNRVARQVDTGSEADKKPPAQHDWGLAISSGTRGRVADSGLFLVGFSWGLGWPGGLDGAKRR